MEIHNCFLAISAICAMLGGCVSKADDALTRDSTPPTGYWYLGDDGRKQWRVLPPDNISNDKNSTLLK